MNNPFDTPYQEVIYKSRYAKWLENENRRENWNETVDRLVGYYMDSIKDKTEVGGIGQELAKAIYNLEVMPSMRALMTAGPALDPVGGGHGGADRPRPLPCTRLQLCLPSC